MEFDYRNVPLERPTEQIRILQLLNTSNDTMDIDMHLCAYDLNDCPPYVAISYTWGDSLPAFYITVNGQPFRIRMNCWYALWQMKHHNVHCHFWVDSICIDQKSIEEKNFQVAMMGVIYGKALMTASCLGSGNHLAVLAHSESSTADRKDALTKLHQKEYWSRMWIKQEIILSKDVRLFCGTKSMDWGAYEETVKSVADTKQRKDLDESPTFEDRETTMQVADTALGQNRLRLRASVFREERDPNPSAELWRLLEQYGDSECHDPRDKIYALLSLLPEGGRAALDLPIDYECELAVLWLKLVRTYLSEWHVTHERLQTECWAIPLPILVVMERMAQHWFRLSLDKPEVRRFIAKWHVESDEGTTDAEAMKLMPTRQHVPILVRFQLRVFKYRKARPGKGRFGMSRGAWMTAAIPVSEVGAWLERNHLFRSPPEPDRYTSDWSQQTMRPFTLSDLPSDARVKVVVAKQASYDLPDAFLVPAFVKPGDQLLGCDMLEHVNTVWQTLIVRFNESKETENGHEKRSILIGWALQLQSDGTLRDGIEYAARPEGLREYSSCVFNLYSEDLVLQALLKQDLLAYFTHPRTHPTHPSFLTEFVPTDTDDDHATCEEDDDVVFMLKTLLASNNYEPLHQE